MKEGEKRPFEIQEWREAGRQFREVFHKEFHYFYSKDLLVIFRQWKVDIFKLDEWFRIIHKDCGEDMSLRDIVEKHYGQKGLDLMERLI